jgi:GNAT superfamily N-acetyltransferase
MFGSENEVVAVCVVTWPKTQPVNVRVIYTLPYARRQGHMSKLLAFVEQAAKDRGYTELASRASTFESRSLYEHRGYRVDATTKEGHKLIKTRLKR